MLEKEDFQVYQEYGKSVMDLYNKEGGGGTGFQIKAPSGKSYIMTNRHVCFKEKRFRVVNKLLDIDQYVKVIEKYNRHDLCILEGIKEAPSLEVSKHVYFNSELFIMGYPSGQGLTLRKGYLVENVKIYPSMPYTPNAYYTTFIGHAGNSGSPILNREGKVISVWNMYDTEREGITYSVPLRYIIDFLSDK